MEEKHKERLAYGAPTNSDVIAAREGYVVGFDHATHCPDWTMYRLTVTNFVEGKVGRWRTAASGQFLIEYPLEENRDGGRNRERD